MVDAWSEVEDIRFGPVTEQNRLERILFWPDRKSIGLKQVQAALADKDTTATDPESLPGRASPCKGSAHWSSFCSAPVPTASRRRETPIAAPRAAIAANLQTIAADVSRRVPDGFAAQWANPGPDNPLYRTDEEALSELFDIFVQGLEMIRDVRLNGFLGRRPEEDKPRQAIYWRSARRSLAGRQCRRLAKTVRSVGIANTTGRCAYRPVDRLRTGNSVKAAADRGPAPPEALKDKRGEISSTISG